MADGYVQVDVDGDGKKIDTEELTRGDGPFTVVERERVTVDFSEVVVLLEQVVKEIRDLKFTLLNALH